MKEILELKSLISNVDIKLATASDVVNGNKNQILAVVTIKDLIVFRYVGICDKSISFKCLFVPNEITSFIVPFIGPHECPNPQKCPNHVTETSMDILKRNSGKRSFSTGKRDQFSTSKVDELISGNGVYNTFYCDQKPGSTSMSNSSSALKDSTETIEKAVSSSSSTTPVDSNVSSSNFMDGSVTSSDSTISTCPFPTTCLWWKTHYEENRAIIGYSDGCIVVVCEYIKLYSLSLTYEKS
jgi:hypothetical protein